MDISQFYQVFFEESTELLDDIEKVLLDIEIDNLDSDTINRIFRAAHSIKGGSGTFGFSDVSKFTHVVETYLDLVRNGNKELTKATIDLLLKAVDCVREQLNGLQNGFEVDKATASDLQAKFQALIDGKDETELSSENKNNNPASEEDEFDSLFDEIATQARDAHESGESWKIIFKPKKDLFKKGNEPLRMFRELAKLGSIVVNVLPETIPNFESYDPTECFLCWEIMLSGNTKIQEVDAVFEWVIGDCDLEVLNVNNLASETAVSIQVDVNQLKTSKPEEPKKKIVVDKTSEEQKKTINETKKVVASMNKEAASVRVAIDKIDSLINMVGELVITQSMLGQITENFDMSRLQSLTEGLSQLEQNSRELQESVMRIRMLPISQTFNRFPRMVRDTSALIGKKIEIKLLGENTEIDKTVLEKIGDPLVHLVRNSMDHGIEMPEVRKANNKPEVGTLTLNAYHQGGSIVIEISDDGAGLNHEKIIEKAIKNGLIQKNEILSHDEINALIFEPGFSTAEKVTDLSGRGVGMDVVRRNIHELGGNIEIRSKMNMGSCITIRLPLTLAILDGQLLNVANQTYIIPIISMIETIQMKTKFIKKVASQSEVYFLREKYIPVLRLYDLFGIPVSNYNLENKFLVVVQVDGAKYGLVIDDLLSQQQVVIKSLEQNYQKIQGISGATILGDGKVALILDVVGLIRMSGTTRKGGVSKQNVPTL